MGILIKVETSAKHKEGDDSIDAYLEEGVCAICDKNKIILTIDNSAGEYPTGGICQDCINLEFEKGI